MAIQTAKALGAHVRTTASPRCRSLVERLGADVVIDYTTQRLEDHLRDMDGVFDLLGGETLKNTFGVVKHGGTVVSIADTPKPHSARRDIGHGGLLPVLFRFASLCTRT